MIYFDHITIAVAASTGLTKTVAQYTKKLVGNPTRCLGYMLSSDYAGATNETVADASINFNSGKHGAICENVRPGISDKSEFMEINQDLCSNAIVKGHVEDLGVVAAPYNVTITFKLEN